MPDPRDGEESFGVFAAEWFAAVSPRPELTTTVPRLTPNPATTVTDTEPTLC